jgi:hypothetical protein
MTTFSLPAKRNEIGTQRDAQKRKAAEDEGGQGYSGCDDKICPQKFEVVMTALLSANTGNRRAVGTDGPVYSILQGISDFIFYFAGTLLKTAFGLVSGSVGAKLVVSGRLADLVLCVSAQFLSGALNFVLVHSSSPLSRTQRGQNLNVPE